MRLLVTTSIWFVILGTFLGGVGYPFIINAKSKVAAVWFKHDSGPAVTTYISLFSFFNNIIALLYPGIW